VAPQTDYPWVAGLLSTARAEPVSPVDLFDEYHGSPPSGQVLRERIAEAAVDGPVGYSRVFRLPWWAEGRYAIHIIVVPAHRGRGIGGLLYDDATAWAASAGATRYDAEMADDDETSLRFARHRGFAINRHLFSSSLAVNDFDPTPFAGTVDEVRSAGIRFFTLADESDTPAARRKLYELNRACSLEIPGREPTFSTFEQYQQRNLSPERYRPELCLCAADGDRWVGLCALVPEGTALYIRMTGVLSGYRGRKIAQALKLLAVDLAGRHGFARLTTNNDAENAPMLAVNRKMGYRPQPGVYLLVKQCSAGETQP